MNVLNVKYTNFKSKTLFVLRYIQMPHNQVKTITGKMVGTLMEAKLSSNN